jgi:hypothetical protein
MKNVTIIILMSFWVAETFAQNNFVKSYIVNEKKDTIWGEAKVNAKKESDAFDKIYFKDAAGIQKTYRANKIMAYGVNDDHFISLDNAGEPQFYKVLARGEINLYMVVYEGMQMNEPTYDRVYYLAKPDNKKLVVVKQNKFKKQISEWMKENPEFIANYEDNKELDVEKAVAVISQFNSWKAGK